MELDFMDAPQQSNAHALRSADPAVSVLLPVHNAERYLREAVESILAQTFSDFELLALDDGSTDSSAAILVAFAATDPRVRVWSRENRGIVETLNQLIGKARGALLARMDADDICLPDRLAVQVRYLETHPECIAVGSKVRFIDLDGLPLFEPTDVCTHDEIDCAHLSGQDRSRIWHPSVMLRRSAVVSAGGYSDDYPFAQDLDLFLRLAEIGKLANVPEVLLEYRQHLASISLAQVNEQRRYARRAVRAAQTRRGASVAPEYSSPTAHREAPEDIYRKWAWWALTGGNVGAARKHAVRALMRNPLSVKNLRVTACAIRGR